MSNNVKTLPIKEPDDTTVRSHLDAANIDLPTREARLQTAYRNYRALGWKPVLLKPGKKRPSQQAWVEKEAPDASLFVGFANIGIALGEKSNGLVDVDLDTQDLIDAAPFFLPITPSKFGRYYGGNAQRLGHWLYIAPDITKTVVLKNPTGKTALELRSTGGQTMFPPSIIFDPEIQQIDAVQWSGRQWHISTEPTIVQGVDLEIRCRVMTASVYAWPFFKEGSFHTDMLAWCGYLVAAGVEREVAELSVRFIADRSRQQGVEDRVQGLIDTIEKHSHKEAVTGLRYLEDGGWSSEFCRWLRQILKFKPGLESDGRPGYKIVQSRENKFFEEISLAMRATGKFFNFNGIVVIITRSKYLSEPEMRHITNPVRIHHYLNREIQFIKTELDPNTNLFRDVPAVPPVRVCQELADQGTEKDELFPIKALSAMPVITKDGRIIESSWGYDEELQVFFACQYSVRRYRVDEALNVLKEPFVDFPFEGFPIQESSSLSGERWCRYRAAALASILTAVVRPVLDICPAFVVTSSQYRDGKTTLCSLPAAVAGSRDATTTQLARGGNEEEQEKQISSILARGRRVVIIDNRDGEFRSGPLVEALTSAAPEFRILGKNEICSVPNKSMFMLNGVNMVLAEDLSTRCVMIKLERHEINSIRKFKHQAIVDWTYNNREDIVSAAICLIEWAMRQDDGAWKRSNRFRDWDFMVRRTVMLACGVDVAPPDWEDSDRVADSVEEAKHAFAEWIIGMWKQGMRSPLSASGSYIRATDIEEKLGLGSELEATVDVLGGNPRHPRLVKVGVGVRKIAGIPYQIGGEVWTLKIGMTNGKVTYRCEKIELPQLGV